MQWLIDIVAQRVIDTIGIPPTYIWRGQRAFADWTIAFFDTDATWYEWDMSAIVPAGATAVLLRVVMSADVADALFELKNFDMASVFFVDCLRTQVANQVFTYLLPMSINADRKLKYWAENVNWTTISVAVEGWWL